MTSRRLAQNYLPNASDRTRLARRFGRARLDYLLTLAGDFAHGRVSKTEALVQVERLVPNPKLRITAKRLVLNVAQAIEFADESL
jgi:hypothetical protein